MFFHFLFCCVLFIKKIKIKSDLKINCHCGVVVELSGVGDRIIIGFDDVENEGNLSSKDKIEAIFKEEMYIYYEILCFWYLVKI